MAVKIGSARIDERGKASGGKAGDQTGNELSTQNWYKHSKGWRVLRCSDSAKAEKIASAMEAACANNNIGYDQAERLTLYNKVKAVGFDPAKITDKCETDCSALVRVCLAYAGITSSNFITSNEARAILATGCFKELTGSKYTDTSDYLKRGDILVTKTKGHTVVVLSDGAKVEPEETPSGDSPIRSGTWNLRAEPDGEIIGTVKAGDAVTLVETDGWAFVKAGGKIGFVSKKAFE